MKINLSPVLRPGTLSVDRSADILEINGNIINFTQVEEGEVLPRDALDPAIFAGPVTRVDGDLVLTLILPHGPDDPEETRFPDPIIDPPDGPVALPPHNSGAEA